MKLLKACNSWVFFQKLRAFRENLASFKKAKSSKFAAEDDWDNKFPQRLQKLVFFKKKVGRFSEKKFPSLKTAKISKYAAEFDWKYQLSQSLQYFFEKSFLKEVFEFFYNR